MRLTLTSQHRRWTAITQLLVVALAAATLGVTSGAPSAHAAAVDITAGSMTWGVKASWRGYAGQGTLSAGAIVAAGGAYQFPLASGTFDPAVGATDLQFTGTVHWQSHYYPNEIASVGSPPDGYTGPTDIYLLDVTLSDPAVHITGAGAEITVELTSRSLRTWQVIDYGRVPIATLDITGIEPAVDAGQTTWADIPVAWAQAGVDAIGYTIGQIVDPLGFTYTGDGSVPIVSESWTPPGTIAVDLAGNALIGDDVSMYPVWTDQTDSVAHYMTYGDTVTFTALDLATLSPIGTPLTVDGNEGSSIGSFSFADPNRNRLYYKSSFDDGALIDSYLEWDPVSATYRIGHDVSIDVGNASLHWDAGHSRLFALSSTMPPGAASPDELEWHLDTYTQDAGGQFTHAGYMLPPAPAGLHGSSWYSLTGATALADGSLLLVRQQVRATDLSVPDIETLAQHLTISGTTVTVTEIAGTDAGNQTRDGYTQVHAAGDTAYLVRPAWFNRPGLVQQLDVAGGAVALAGPAVGLDGVVADIFAVDPTDATLWGLSGSGQTLIAVADGRLVARHFSPYISQTGAALTVGTDHRVYTASSDGQPREFGEPSPLGYAAFDRVGVSPTVTVSPSAVDVVVDPSTATPVTYTAAATGDPAPTIRWQQRPPGAVVFTDLAGANDTTLSVDATPSLANTEYRAVFTNAAGSIATEPATLTVRYAPIITTQPISTTVGAGGDATFQVHATASPEPTIAWQRLVDGAWVDLAAGSDDYSGESTGTLTITSVTAADTATTYRATITNAIGTVASDPATLTVTAGAGDGDQEIVVAVPEPGAGEFAWEVQGAGRDVALGAATDAGDHWAATGSILPITVADTRANGPAWSLSGQVSDFGPVSGKYLGWTPQLIGAGGGAQAGAAVPSGLASGDGLSAAAVLADAPAGHAAGTATVGAALDLRLPRDTPPGTYTATLTITALS